MTGLLLALAFVFVFVLLPLTFGFAIWIWWTDLMPTRRRSDARTRRPNDSH